MFHLTPVDAVAPNPKSGAYVWLRGKRYVRSLLETAWLTLADGGGRIAAKRVLLNDAALDLNDCKDYVNAAESWTGNVVAGEVR